MRIQHFTSYLDFSSFNPGEITLGAIIISMCFFFTAIVCAMDVRSAIRRDKRFAHDLAVKAIEEGRETCSVEEVEKRLSPKLNSWGIKRTIAKLGTYYNILFPLVFLDILLLITDVWRLIHFLEVPYASMAISVVFIGNEAMSIWENSPKRDKENVAKSLRRFRQTAKDLAAEISGEDVKELRQLLSEIRDNQNR
jgi:hypothetical protein|nr:MAG TPA: holin [Caudoviricetes sp.]